MRKLLLALIAVMAFAVGCHGTWQTNGGIWYLTSQECADGTSGIAIDSPALAHSAMQGSTGSFTADSYGCHVHNQAANSIGVFTDLYKQNVGLCATGSGWHLNPNNYYAAQVQDPITYVCGSGNYFVLATNWVSLAVGGDQYHWTNSPGDAY